MRWARTMFQASEISCYTPEEKGLAFAVLAKTAHRLRPFGLRCFCRNHWAAFAKATAAKLMISKVLITNQYLNRTKDRHTGVGLYFLTA